MQKLNKAFLLAAGLGTRLKPFTDVIAKPAIPFWGLPQFLYPYYFAKDLGITNWAYNTHHKAETIKSALNDYNLHGVEFFESQLLDSAGGIFNAKSFLETEEHFLVLNSDSLFVYQDILQIQKAFDEHIRNNYLATLFTIEKNGAGETFSGLWSNSENMLVAAGLSGSLTESERKNLKSTHFIGITIFSKTIFSYLQPGPSNIIHDHLIPVSKNEPIKVVPLTNFDWFELGRTQDFIDSHKTVTQNLDSYKYSADSFPSFYRTQTYFNPQWNYESYAPKGMEKRILES